MRVFLAGATGVIGRRLVPRLVEGGHDVVGMTRDPAKADQLRGLGAEPIVCDVFDSSALERAVMQSSPEVVINQLTDLPPVINPRRADRDSAGNDRIRTEGTSNLAAAAAKAGVGRMISQSIAFAYDLRTPGIKTEDDPLFDEAPFPWSRSVAALRALEDATLKTEGIEGTVLRYGFFYGPGSSYARDGEWGRQVSKRRLPLIKGARGVFSFIHVDDAAAATVAALDRSAAARIYNVVDDEPAPVTEWLPAFARGLGAKPPRTVPRWLAKLGAGRFGLMMMGGMQGASNARIKNELGWEPRYRSWREGFAADL